MIGIISKGGVIMWPIAFCAFITLVIIIERFLFFRITDVNYNYFKGHLLEKIEKEHLHEMGFTEEYSPSQPSGNIFNRLMNLFKNIGRRIEVLKWNRSPYVKMAHEYVINIRKGEKSRNEALVRLGSEEIEKMENHFRILSAISSSAPLLGLLGTVVGIIQSFQTIQGLGGQVDVNALAGGIWVAMITTAAGLIVAIPAQMGYMFFDKKVTERANRMSYIITYLNEKIFSLSDECANEGNSDSEELKRMV
jgi:biopolymer transport protein ExbB/TolQ